MSDSKPSKVFMFDNGDPEVQGAYEKARETFRYFWRELAWEYRRIIPALDLACVKAPFSDGDGANRDEGQPAAEQMWINEVEFDGKTISGTLVNAPNWVTSVKQGDAVRKEIAEITDWMYGIGGVVYGAFTVNLMRSRMSKGERNDHDSAWGLDFGDPETIRIVPQKKSWFSRKPPEIQEHPMSEAMASDLMAQVKKYPSMLTVTDDRGWTYLHQLALAGSAAGVKVLLDAGMNVNILTRDGRTAKQLAASLGWNKVVDLLASKGAR